MKLSFTKMHGLGNDFMVVDATTTPITLSPPQIKALSNRHTGVGFDQLLFIEPPQGMGEDFHYRIFNADGQEVEQCGNGARCVGHYLYKTKGLEQEKIRLGTVKGLIEVQKEAGDEMTVNMGEPVIGQAQTQLTVLDREITLGTVSLGNPHAVIRVDDINQAPVQTLGQALQSHEAFPFQVNVGFMQIISPQTIKLRVYERGVGETFACGSGACAAVAIGRLAHGLAENVTVELTYGNLVIHWLGPASPLVLTGPAQIVYKGEVDI